MTDVDAVPAAPPADAVSSARPRRLPNWVLKTAMAVTGTLLAVILVGTMIGVIWLFANYAAMRQAVDADANWAFFVWGPTTLPWVVGVVVGALVVTHAAIAVVLWRRSRAGRGPVKARIAGLYSWWTRSMPVTGTIAALGAVSALIWPCHIEVSLSLPDCRPDLDCHPFFTWSVTYPLPLWAGYAIYLVALLAAGLHAARGLQTVATIAAGSSAFAGQVRHWAVIVGGPLMALLVVASALVPLAFWQGWI